MNEAKNVTLRLRLKFITQGSKAIKKNGLSTADIVKLIRVKNRFFLRITMYADNEKIVAKAMYN